MGKVNLKSEALAAMADADEPREELVTDAILKDLCPKEFLARLKAAKKPAQRADLLYDVDTMASLITKEAERVKKFVSKLEQWFIQELPEDDATGISGKVANVAIKRKEIAVVADWDKFYANIKKKGEFELLNRAVNQKAVKERWEAKKMVPGVEKFTKRTISLTKVKGV